MDYLDMILAQLGMHDIRRDAKATAVLSQQLEYLKAQTYDIKYPSLKARRFIPVDNSVPSGAESYAYEQWDEYGMADIISNYADDLTLVDTLVEKFTAPIHSLGKAYQITLQDLRAAAMSGNRLPDRRARATRRAFELKVEDLAAVGDAPAKLKGMVNHANVTIYTALNDGTATEWTTGRATPKSAANIQHDMHTLVTNIRNTTMETHSPNTLIMGTVEYAHISQTPVGTDNQTTILRSFLANNPFITDVDSWQKLDTADAAGTGPRVVCYERDPEVLQLVIPQEYEQLPPQARNLSFLVPTHGRIGGVSIHYPLAMAYMDGT